MTDLSKFDDFVNNTGPKLLGGADPSHKDIIPHWVPTAQQQRAHAAELIEVEMAVEEIMEQEGLSRGDAARVWYRRTYRIGE